MHQTVRSALRLSSPTMAARRQAPIKAVMPRRMASSSTQAAQQTVKSDAPWAIASLLVFGSLFVYVTSPPSKGSAHGGHGDSHGAHKAEASAAQDEGEDGASSASDESYEDVKKIEEKPGEGAPRGAKVGYADPGLPGPLLILTLSCIHFRLWAPTAWVLRKVLTCRRPPRRLAICQNQTTLHSRPASRPPRKVIRTRRRWSRTRRRWWQRRKPSVKTEMLPRSRRNLRTNRGWQRWPRQSKPEREAEQRWHPPNCSPTKLEAGVCIRSSLESFVSRNPRRNRIGALSVFIQSDSAYFHRIKGSKSL